MQLNFFSSSSYKSCLYFNNTESLFEYNEIIPKNANSDTEKDLDQNGSMVIHDNSLHQVKCNKINKEIREYFKPFDDRESFCLKDTLVLINWTVTVDKKKISNHECTKALCTFRGRNYVAWYTSDIPTNFGPLKLHGLPGLILELYDEKKEVFLYAKGIEQKVKRIEEERQDIKIMSQVDLKKKIADAAKMAVEEANRFSSKMSRGLKTTIKISPFKSIEME